MNELALFAGTGGGILGGKLLGWRTVCAIERDAYAAQVLAQRQNDGILEAFPIWSDITNFDGKPWQGIVDVVSGGFPCQDISAAGKGAGIEGARSGMWKEMARIIGEVRPQYAFVENSPMLTTRGLGTVLADLASMGFDAEWGVLSAADVGANHQRERIWIVAKQRDIFSHTEHHGDGWWKQLTQGAEKENGTVANAKELFSNGSNNNARISMERKEKSKFRNDCWSKNMADTNGQHGKRWRKPQQPTSIGWQAWHKFRGCGTKILRNTNSQDVERQRQLSSGIESQLRNVGNASWWQSEPQLGRVANGVANRVDRLKAIGNGQVPLCAATAFELLRARLTVI